MIYTWLYEPFFLLCLSSIPINVYCQAVFSFSNQIPCLHLHCEQTICSYPLCFVIKYVYIDNQLSPASPSLLHRSAAEGID